jgi:hypothetical protein
MQTSDDEKIVRTAYHESGHIVVTYLTGYTCDSVELLTTEPGKGKMNINYQDDLLLAASIMNAMTDPGFFDEYFNNLSDKVKQQSPGVAHRLTTILLAGSAAESTYLNGGKVNGNMEIETSGRDLIRVDNVHFFLSQIKPDHNINYIQNTLESVLVMMSVPEVWKAVESLAMALMSKANKRLDKSEIETILMASGYLKYIATL